MSEISNLNGSGTSIPFSAATEQTSTYTDTVFQRLEQREVEQFYKSYHFWLLQRRIETLHIEASAVQQAIIDNHTLMQHIPLSAIALASLAQLQASGVSDLNLLDRMLERGETWLDHTMQLLEHCEKLDVIRGDYTQWCEHALEGAYDWIASMEGTEAQPENNAETPAINDEQQTQLHTVTEEQLLQKLMNDEEATEKLASLNSFLSEARERTLAIPNRKITQPLDHVEPTPPETHNRKITQPLEQTEPATLEASLPGRTITQPLGQGEVLIETELAVEVAIPTATEQIEAPDSANSEIILQPEIPLSQEDAEDDAARTVAMPALSIEQISEPSNEVDTERSPGSNTMPDPGNQIIEELHSEHSVQIDAMKHMTEAPDEGLQESTTQEVAVIEAEDAFKDANIHTTEDAIVSEEASAETGTDVVAISKSPQGNKKVQPQKVRRWSFWRLLNRLLTIILRR